MMTSHQLARQLLEGPDEPILQAVDPEGNSFYEVAETGCYYVDKSESYQHECVMSEEDLKDVYEDEDPSEFVKKVIVIWP